jgi:hypothetical protein
MSKLVNEGPSTDGTVDPLNALISLPAPAILHVTTPPAVPGVCDIPHLYPERTGIIFPCYDSAFINNLQRIYMIY